MVHIKHLQLYNSNMSLIGILENATAKGYVKKLNNLWSASFSMPANDPKVKLCTPFSIVEMFDGDERVDLFRILPSSHSSNDSSEIVKFDCEHVLGTLVDDILFQYHERINLSTTNVITYILGFQTTSKWQLGQVDFNYSYTYKWESENLLSALLSIVEPFPDEYQWTWNTTTTPWTLNLVRPSTEIKTWIRYGRNLRNVEKRIDPTSICTRMYGLGYGEGVNQLTIKDVNSGLPYIDASTIGTYGIVSKIYTDPKEENATTLKSKMQAALEKLKIPKTQYTVSAAHLYQITKNNIDEFYLGEYSRVIDKEDDLTFTARVVTLAKSDIDENPGDIQMDIANSREDISTSVSNLSDRQRINEVYSQGATNIFAQDFADNCDPTYPATIRFYIPEETVRINKMELNYKTQKFRAYSRGTVGGGASTTTSSSGGGVSTTTAAGGAVVESSSDGYWELSNPHFLPGDYMNGSSADNHVHSMYSVNHTHNVTMPAHFHALILSAHDHTITLADHIHNINYGIYLNATLPTAITVKVDGNTVPNLGINEDKVNIIPYLEVDSNGKIRRGAWHEISITPNDLARIEANIVTQLFIQSRGGGSY